MTSAPWDSVPARDTFFVLVTGANSGIGFGICQRLIDDFLSSRSLSSHLVLIPTTRSAEKSRSTIGALRRHCRDVAEGSETLRSRAGPGYQPRDTTSRIHLLSVQLDLCNLYTIRDVARQLNSGTVSSVCSSDDLFAPLIDVRIPRLDAVIFNAGIGGFTGLNWPLVAVHFLTKGVVQATTWPRFKSASAGLTIDPLSGSKKVEGGDTTKPAVVGEVFCANVFGHYLFAHALLPLLSRPRGSSMAPGRIIWESSIEGTWKHLSLSDFQAIKTKAPYESTKRLTDILALTCDAPAARPYSSGYLGAAREPAATTPPKMYLTHPGVVHSTLFPLNAFLFFWYRVVLYLARLLGSPWHPVTAYKGAYAPAWLALQDQEALDNMRAERIKWGTSTDRWGLEAVKKTEVEGWGWEGRVEDRAALAADDATGVLRKMVGRKSGAMDLTEEKKEEFEALGAECWRAMEELRREWEARLG